MLVFVLMFTFMLMLIFMLILHLMALAMCRSLTMGLREFSGSFEDGWCGMSVCFHYMRSGAVPGAARRY